MQATQATDKLTKQTNIAMHCNVCLFGEHWRQCMNAGMLLEQKMQQQKNATTESNNYCVCCRVPLPSTHVPTQPCFTQTENVTSKCCQYHTIGFNYRALGTWE